MTIKQLNSGWRSKLETLILIIGLIALVTLWIGAVFLYGYYLNDIEDFLAQLKGDPLKRGELKLVFLPFFLGLVSFVFAGSICLHIFMENLFNRDLDGKFYYIISFLICVTVATGISAQFQVPYHPVSKDIFRVFVWGVCNFWAVPLLIAAFAVRVLHQQSDR